MTWTVEHLLAGKAQIFRGAEKSAIAKRPLSGKVRITRLGLVGDEQANRDHHGGPHMAVHQYPADHYDFWRSELEGHPLLADPGAFGTNLTVEGLDEEGVHIGDRFRLGTALLEISQPRKPCWKIEHHFQRKEMVEYILRTALCGWYYRVIEEGEAEAGDTLIREHTADPKWRVDKVFFAIWGNPKAASQDYLHGLAHLETLTPKVREKVAARLG